MSMALRRSTTDVRAVRSPVVDLAICLSAYAALAHAVAVPAHFRVWPAAGLLFIALSAAQGLLAVMLVRDRVSPAMIAASLWLNVGVACVYVVSRTSGIPFAPRASAHGGRVLAGQSLLPKGTPDGIGPLDLSTLVAELLLIVVLLSVMNRSLRQRTTTLLACVGTTLWVLALTGVLS
jgi:hypothetical protein